jgi:ATP-dependent Clp protease ATP-binding subunit ClpB
MEADMRFDKLTTKFQQALSDAQSIALGADNPVIEAQHLLLALLNQDDGSTSALLARAGVQINPLKTSLQTAIDNLPKASESSGDVAISRDLNNLLNLTDKQAQKRNDTYIASEMFLLALADDKGEAAKLLKQHGLTKAALEAAVMAVRGNENVNSQEAEGQREALKKIHTGFNRARPHGQARPSDWP